MNKNNMQFLSVYSMFLKTMALISVVGGLVNMGVFIYIWGRVKAFYDVIQTTINGLAALSELGLSNPTRQLPDFPLWPLLLILLTLFAIMVIVAMTLWAISSYLDIRLNITQKEVEQYYLLNKKLDGMLMEFNFVANYFRSLPQKQKSQ